MSKDWTIIKIFGQNVRSLKGMLQEAEKRFQSCLDLGMKCEICDEANLKRILEYSPYCNCGLDFASASEKTKIITQGCEEVASIPLLYIQFLAEFLLKDDVKSKLAQVQDSLLEQIVKAKGKDELADRLRSYPDNDLLTMAVKINTLLGNIRLKRVPITLFKPKTRLVSQDEIEIIFEEFRTFIKGQFEEPGDVLEILGN